MKMSVCICERVCARYHEIFAINLNNLMLHKMDKYGTQNVSLPIIMPVSVYVRLSRSILRTIGMYARARASCNVHRWLYNEYNSWKFLTIKFSTSSRFRAIDDTVAKVTISTDSADNIYREVKQDVQKWYLVRCVSETKGRLSLSAVSCIGIWWSTYDPVSSQKKTYRKKKPVGFSGFFWVTLKRVSRKIESEGLSG